MRVHGLEGLKMDDEAIKEKSCQTEIHKVTVFKTLYLPGARHQVFPAVWVWVAYGTIFQLSQK